MKHIVVLVLGLAFFSSCKNEIPKEWAYKKTIKIDGVNPIGIANANGDLWLSDGDHNRLVQIDKKGEILKTIDSLDRPMHIDAVEKVLYVPQYGNDKLEVFYPQANLVVAHGYKREEISLIKNDSLDAPSGISVNNEQIAVTDFYNNRILYNDGKYWISFGKKGQGEGEFYYPTDVQITDTAIWVADAYNNRIQVFDKKGNFVQLMGQDQKMNAATGLFVSENEVFITDFEHNRVLVFDHEGLLLQELKEGIAKATDLLVKDGMLHIINYRTGGLVLYELVEKKE